MLQPRTNISMEQRKQKKKAIPKMPALSAKAPPPKKEDEPKTIREQIKEMAAATGRNYWG